METVFFEGDFFRLSCIQLLSVTIPRNTNTPQESVSEKLSEDRSIRNFQDMTSKECSLERDFRNTLPYQEVTFLEIIELEDSERALMMTKSWEVEQKMLPLKENLLMVHKV